MNQVIWESLLEESRNYLEAQQQRLESYYRVGRYERYDYDLKKGELTFSDEGQVKLRADVTVLGSFSSRSGTWKWAWGNDQFNELDTSESALLRDFGEDNDLEKLAMPTWDAEESDGWQMAAVAARLLEAQGAYRSPNPTGHLYMLLSNLRFENTPEWQDPSEPEMN